MFEDRKEFEPEQSGGRAVCLEFKGLQVSSRLRLPLYVTGALVIDW